MSDLLDPNAQQQQGNAAQQQPAQQPATAPIVQVEKETVYQQIPNYTGNTALETSINVFAATTGVTSERFSNALTNALEYGDSKLINYDALTAGLKPEQAAQARALADAAFKEQTAAMQASIQSGTNQVYQLAGGQEQWNEAAAAFNTNAPEHIRTIVREMLQRGQVVEAGTFVLETVRGNGMVNYGTGIVQGGAGSTVATEGGLSKREYFDELNKLNRSAGNTSWDSSTTVGQKLLALQARRQLGVKQGRN